ncbi:cytochrome b561 [Roseibium hamelinense]|uniref:Cytochrome b561 n=1 Tax=Roseibium hamelinense TaxID=150831 RepID=A0A562T7I2_9HYPH|nr:cytochrome b [Roseibium hamelinense]MTI42979.1 cytochrome b [Roseibium hamelinense]TWI89589.1 cytochrome b561 [Roseibium hamelinense]
MIRNTKSGYGHIAIAFHWIMALIIIGMLGMGLYMTSLPQTDPLTFQLYQLHKSFGFVILTLVVLRLGWRLLNPAPKLPNGMKPWERAAAHLGHTGLYALMFLIPISGWFMVSASPWNIPTVVFNVLNIPHLPVPGFLGTKEQAEGVFKFAHEYMAYFMIALVIAHVGAALKHHFIARDATLRRMVSTAPARDGL